MLKRYEFMFPKYTVGGIVILYLIIALMDYYS